MTARCRSDRLADLPGDGLTRLRAVLGAAQRCTGTGRVDAAAIADATAVVEHLSDVLLDIATELGVESTLARRVLRLRSELDSHMLASAVLDDPAIDPQVRVQLLQRGVETVARVLPAGVSSLAQPG